MAWPRGISKTLSPEQRSARARNAALARTTVDAHINALVGKSLSHAQRRKLRDIMRDATRLPASEKSSGGDTA